MKKMIYLVLAWFLFSFLTHARAADESAWKGEADPSQFDFSAMIGLGIVDPNAGFSVIGAAAKKLMPDGFIPDIRNAVWGEIQFGPIFTSGTSAFQYSAHLRWDFRRDSIWTFYALGGVGGHISGAALGDRFVLHPRVGVGTFWQVSPVVRMRAEASHELILVGVNFPL